MIFRRTAGLICGLALLLSGCGGSLGLGSLMGGGDGPSDAEIAALQAAPAPDAGSSYRVGPGDQLRITVYGEDDLSGEYTLDGAGAVSMPLLGQVSLDGLTAPEVESTLATSLEDRYLLNPRVSVEVLNYRPFYIIGEVMTGGEFPYQDGISVLNAVAMAGGFTFRARTSGMMIRRGAEQIEVRDPAVEPVQPGDVIVVRERFF
jgi:polysaccharide export outer membrane protein